MDQRFYQSSQFAQKASVSVRTLRYYDKMGLLSPSYYTETGYRLYTNEDLLTLQNILYTSEEQDFLEKALAIYQQQQG